MHVDVTLNATADLRKLRAKDPAAAAAILVAFQQIQVDPRAIDKLLTHGNSFVGSQTLNIKKWERMQRMGNLWRFRILDTPATNYRVVYGYHWQTRQICILAVVHKGEFDYDDTESDLSQRILADWRSL